MPHLRRPSSVDRQPSAVDLPPSTGHRAAPPPPSTPLLRSYFQSGWAFLIPYLLTYLLYAWRKWPANPVAGGQLPVTGDSPPSTVHWLPIPPLLYVYWALHAINLVLAALALRSWWKDAQRAAISDQPSAISSDNPARSSQFSVLLPESSGLRSQTSALGSASADTPGPSLGEATDCPPLPSTAYSLLATRYSLLGRLAPWLLLALIFAIPGVYLEWPSDPWEHLRRITEWATHPVVANHSAGYKSFYFFAYSWVGWLSPIHLMSWLNVYYVGVCLLLAWQYYLLAKAVGLNRRWAFLSVIVNVLTFGNSCFSFYRYYALASTVFAQIGAVALTRTALEYAKSIGQSAESKAQRAKDEERRNGRPLPVTGSAERSCASGENQESKAWPRRFWKTLTPSLSALRRRFAAVRLALCPLRARSAHYSLLRLGAASGALLLLIAYNHIQGIGIAGLGVAAVIIWRLIEWNRSMIFWLAATSLIVSAAMVLWWPRNSLVDLSYRQQGWLNAWYGFNLLAWPSPAAERAVLILGFTGLAGFVAGALLLRRNYVVGWLTVLPVVCLCLPCVAIPFASRLAAYGDNEILGFHRMLFAVPAPLAISICLRDYGFLLSRWWSPFKCLSALGAIAFLTVASPGGLSNNRLWQALAVVPDDLQISYVVLPCETGILRRPATSQLMINGPGNAVLEVLFQQTSSDSFRLIGQPAADSLDLRLARIPAPDRSSSNPSGARTPRPLQPLVIAVTPSTWTTLSGAPVEFVAVGNPSESGFQVLQNPVGAFSEVFVSALFPIDPAKTYRLELAARQTGGTDASVFLAVAWYDASGHFLPSNENRPQGAGNPAGWINGTYSYFGLVAAPPPEIWTKYGIEFGFGETANIPRQARYLRLGALLNQGTRPSATATAQIAQPRFTELPRPALVLAIPLATNLFSPTSHAAIASRHWPQQQAAGDQAGARELETRARELGAIKAPGPEEMNLYRLPSSDSERPN